MPLLVPLLVPGVPALLMVFLVVMERLEARVLPAPGPARPERVASTAAARRTVPRPGGGGTGVAIVVAWTVDTVDPASRTPAGGQEAVAGEVVEEPVGRQSAQA